MTNEATTFKDVYRILTKYRPMPNEYVVLPYEEYNKMCELLEFQNELHTKQRNTNQTKQENPLMGSISEKTWTTVQMVDTTETTAGKSFVDALRLRLVEEKIMVNEKVFTEKAAVKESDQGNVLIVTGNIAKFDFAQQTVDNCLEYVDKDQYGRTIVIVLHVKREDKLPSTDTRDQLKSTEYNKVGKILDMGYLRNDGEIYSCSKNDKAVEEICTWIQGDYTNKRQRTEQSASGHDVVPKAKRIDSKDTGEKTWTTVQMVDTTETTAGKTFVDALRLRLVEEKIMVNEKVFTEKAAVKESDQGNVLIVTGNIAKFDFAQQTVDKCLEYVDKDQYGRTIVIVLHVKRKEKLPSTDTRDQLKSTEYNKVGKILDMGYLRNDGEIYSCSKNDKALEEIYTWIQGDYTNKRQRTEQSTSVHNVTPKAKPIDSDCKATEQSRLDAYLLTNPNNSLTGAAKMFQDRLEEEMKNRGVIFHKIENLETNERYPDRPIFVICNNHSRITADLDHCLQDISSKKYGRMVLVVLHVSRTSKPSTHTWEELRSDEKYKAIPKIIDMAFDTEEGIYSCKMNEDAFKELTDLHIYQNMEYKVKDDNVHTEASDDEKMKQISDATPEKILQNKNQEGYPV